MDFRGGLGTACAALLLTLTTPVGAAPPSRPIAVTIDDLPLAASDLHISPSVRARITDELLAVLAKHRVRAVGLVSWGKVLPTDHRLLRKWLDAGHELGNHGYDHLSFTDTPVDRYIVVDCTSHQRRGGVSDGGGAEIADSVPEVRR